VITRPQLRDERGRGSYMHREWAEAGQERGGGEEEREKLYAKRVRGGRGGGVARGETEWGS